MPKNLLKKIGYIPHYLRLYTALFRIIVLRILAVASGKGKGAWVILERGYDAQDNAWHFFKYMVKEHPEVPVRFAIKKSSPDFINNLSGYENLVLEYNSPEYYKWLFNSDVIVSTHVNTFTPELFVTTKLQSSPFRFKGKTVFLQHGIIHRDLKGLKYPGVKVDLFISGAANEYALLKREYGYPDDIIQYTGLARYDNLVEFKVKRQVLVMPTWRVEYAGYSDEEFIKTPFFLEYSALLADSNLNLALERNDYTLVFYNHFEFRRFSHCFEPFANDRISICEFGSKRVQELLKESAVLLTDYSSIYYDFLYMKKPIVFFQFDKKEFDMKHYGKTFDDVSEFGYFTISHGEATGRLVELLDSGCEIDNFFSRKADKIFKYRDNKNCERIYKATKLKLLKSNPS